MHDWNKIDSDTYTHDKASTITRHCEILLTMYLKLHHILTRALDWKFSNLSKYYEAKLEQSLTKDEYTLFIEQKKRFMNALLNTIDDEDNVHKKKFNELAHNMILPIYEPHLKLIW